MRKLAAAAVALPVVLVLYAPMLLRHSRGARLVVATFLAGTVGIGAIGAVGIFRPTGTAATPPSQPVPLTSAAFTTALRVGESPATPVEVAFSAPMDATSVEAALSVTPRTAVRLSWNADRTVLRVTPRLGWRTGTLHTITVAPGALATSGRPLTKPARATFLTRGPTHATISPTRSADGTVRLDSAFVVEFDRPMDLATLGGAVLGDPAIPGTLEALGRRGATRRFLFVPTDPLTPGATYRLWLSATARDVDGAALAGSAAIRVVTAVAPTVVRYRPRNATTGIDPGAVLSVRFSQPMNRAATAEAFSVAAAGKPVAGTVRWAEGDTVLVFVPKVALGYTQKVVMRVAMTATSADGVPLAGESTGTFTTAAKPPATPPTPTSRTESAPSGTGGGSWAAVEAYYLDLMNCTRTGGLVTSTGACSSPGGRDVAPLRLDAGISTKVARPYAKLLATRNLCSHFANGGPGDRLRRAGYSSYNWAENLGCRSGNPFGAVLGSHLYFQSERNWSPVGGHYVNLMNAKYDRAGIGVWVYGGRVRLVVNFYRP